MKIVLQLAVLIMTFTSHCAFAAMTTLKGQQLLNYCEAAADILNNNIGRVQIQSEYIIGSKAGMCEGYMMSVSEKKGYCFPVNYTLAYGAAVVVKYLKTHPYEQNQNANTIISKAFELYFPCHKSNKLTSRKVSLFVCK